MRNLDLNALMAPVQNGNPGHFNDPDMLQVAVFAPKGVDAHEKEACGHAVWP